MAIQANVGCKTLIKTGTGSADALESLGYTIEGVNIEERMYREDVHSDQNSGTSGPPVDIMYHGEVHIISFDMVYFDPAVAAKVQYIKGATAGVASSPCLLMLGDSKFTRILLTGTGFTRNYLRGVVTQKSIGRVGTHPSVMRMTIECYPDDSGNLWDTTIT